MRDPKQMVPQLETVRSGDLSQSLLDQICSLYRPTWESPNVSRKTCQSTSPTHHDLGVTPGDWVTRTLGSRLVFDGARLGTFHHGLGGRRATEPCRIYVQKLWRSLQPYELRTPVLSPTLDSLIEHD